MAPGQDPFGLCHNVPFVNHHGRTRSLALCHLHAGHGQLAGRLPQLSDSGQILDSESGQSDLSVVGTPDVDLLAFCLSWKVFVGRTRDPLADAMDALMTP